MLDVGKFGGLGMHGNVCGQSMRGECVLQGMAGNIVHAIATTNAIVSGLIVAEATKLLAGLPENCRVQPFIQAPIPLLAPTSCFHLHMCSCKWIASFALSSEVARDENDICISKMQ